MQSIKMLRKIYNLTKVYPFFLFLLPINFIHVGYNELFSSLSFSFIAKSLFIVAGGIALIFFCTLYYFKDAKKTYIFTFIFSIFNLYFGFIHDTLKEISIIHFITQYILFVPISILIFFIVMIRLKKSKSTFYLSYQYLNLVMIVLLIFETGKSIIHYDQVKKGADLIDPRFSVFKYFKNMNATPDSLKPDIYFIIFDEMPSSLGLKKYFGVENKEIEDSLVKKGFFINHNARSNYIKTIFSMSSMLNMEYLPNSEYLKEDPATIMSCQKSISNNSLFSILKLNNYKLITYQPFAHVDTGMNASPFLINLKDGHYFYKTLTGRIYRDVFWKIYNIHMPFVNKLYYKREISLREKRKKGVFITSQLIRQSCSLKNDRPVFFMVITICHTPPIL